MPSSVVGDGRKTVTTAGTAERLVSSTSVRCNSVCISALSTNTGTVCVGSSAVVAAAGTRRGTPLAASESVTYTAADLSLIWLDVTVNGEGVSYSYEAS